MRQRRRLFVSIANKLIFGRLGIAGLAFLRLRVAQVGWHWQLRRNWPGLPLHPVLGQRLPILEHGHRSHGHEPAHRVTAHFRRLGLACGHLRVRMSTLVML